MERRCPGCDAVVNDDDEECPNCGLSFADDEPEVEP
jgi:RNA polymerase subunit RPABC4/transcription elongation factor Spt4